MSSPLSQQEACSDWGFYFSRRQAIGLDKPDMSLSTLAPSMAMHFGSSFDFPTQSRLLQCKEVSRHGAVDMMLPETQRYQRLWADKCGWKAFELVMNIAFAFLKHDTSTCTHTALRYHPYKALTCPGTMLQEMSEGNLLRWPKQGFSNGADILGMYMRYRYSDNSFQIVKVKYGWYHFGECLWMLFCDKRQDVSFWKLLASNLLGNMTNSRYQVYKILGIAGRVALTCNIRPSCTNHACICINHACRRARLITPIDLGRSPHWCEGGCVKPHAFKFIGLGILVWWAAEHFPYPSFKPAAKVRTVPSLSL